MKKYRYSVCAVQLSLVCYTLRRWMMSSSGALASGGSFLQIVDVFVNPYFVIDLPIVNSKSVSNNVDLLQTKVMSCKLILIELIKKQFNVIWINVVGVWPSRCSCFENNAMLWHKKKLKLYCICTNQVRVSCNFYFRYFVHDFYALVEYEDASISLWLSKRIYFLTKSISATCTSSKVSSMFVSFPNNRIWRGFQNKSLFEGRFLQVWKPKIYYGGCIRRIRSLPTSFIFSLATTNLFTLALSWWNRCWTVPVSLIYSIDCFFLFGSNRGVL